MEAVIAITNWYTTVAIFQRAVADAGKIIVCTNFMNGINPDNSTSLDL